MSNKPMKHPNSFTPAEVWQTNKTEVIASAIIAIAAIIDFCYGSWFLGAITLLLSAMFLINAYLLTYISTQQALAKDFATSLDEALDNVNKLTIEVQSKDKNIKALKKTIDRQQRELNNTRKDVESWKAQCRKHESNAQ
jgi:septal ring factor EnvC (AmiA/AmiB activator)